MTLSGRVLEAGRALLAADSDSFTRTIPGFVSVFVGQPYLALSAVLEGAGGRQSASFSCVVFTGGEGESRVPVGEPVPIRCAAAVIDGCDELSLEELRDAYARIAEAKRMAQKGSATGTPGRRSELLGVILARRSFLNLEAIAEEMRRLNAATSATLWPDMVAVADTGVVQYSAQFPGENVTGDFFLPSERLSFAAPMYIVMVMKPSGAHTLNRMLSFVVGHLALFAPGADVPKFPDIVEGIANTGVTLTGYQCNLAGEIAPVPRTFYNDRYLAPLPFYIDDGRGRVLAAVQFLRWQDGGVILLRGELPLEMLLVFLGPASAKERNCASAGATDFVCDANHRGRLSGDAGAVSPTIKHGGAAGRDELGREEVRRRRVVLTVHGALASEYVQGARCRTGRRRPARPVRQSVSSRDDTAP